MLWWGASLHDDLQEGFLFRTIASSAGRNQSLHALRKTPCNKIP
jgi:hypothetical protein